MAGFPLAPTSVIGLITQAPEAPLTTPVTPPPSAAPLAPSTVSTSAPAGESEPATYPPVGDTPPIAPPTPATPPPILRTGTPEAPPPYTPPPILVTSPPQSPVVPGGPAVTPPSSAPRVLKPVSPTTGAASSFAGTPTERKPPLFPNASTPRRVPSRGRGLECHCAAPFAVGCATRSALFRLVCRAEVNHPHVWHAGPRLPSSLLRGDRSRRFRHRPARSIVVWVVATSRLTLACGPQRAG